MSATRLTESEFQKLATALRVREQAGESQAVLSTEFIELGKRLTGRECGECSLCCKVLDIDELSKPPGKWCQHCRPGTGGCGIYDTRPVTCRSFACFWLTSPRLSEAWKPSRARIVVHLKKDEDGPCHWDFIVDPSRPERWREQPYYGVIKQVAFNGLNVVDGIYFQTYVKTKRQSILVRPEKEVDVTGRYHVIGNDGDAWEWKVATFATQAAANRFIDATNEASAKLAPELPPIAQVMARLRPMVRS